MFYKQRVDYNLRFITYTTTPNMFCNQLVKNQTSRSIFEFW